MKETISAAIYETHGKPADVLQIRELPQPHAGEGEVVVEMRAAPINPADLNAIEGKYPIRPALPATPGFEGSGFVAEIGAGVQNLSVGRTRNRAARCWDVAGSGCGEGRQISRRAEGNRSGAIRDDEN